MEFNQTKFQQTELGRIPEDWEVFELKNIGSFKGGVSSIKRSDYGYGTPFISYKNIFDNSKIDINKLELMNVPQKDLERCDCKYGDFFFTASSETYDEVAMSSVLLGSVKNLTFNGFSKRFRLNDFDNLTPEYGRYLFRSKIFRNQIEGKVTGDIRFNVSQEILGSIKVPLPSIYEQQEIAGVLGTLDEKIELNRKMNKTLEQIGQVIFRQLSVNNKNVLEISPLSDFGKIVCGKTPSKANSEYFSGGTPLIKIPDMHGQTFIIKTEDSLTEKGKVSQANKTIPANSICVSCIATVGLVSLTSEESQTNQQINSIIPNKKEFTYYLYFALKNIAQDIRDMASGGSATLNLNTGTFSNIELVTPEDNILMKFDNAVRPIFEQIYINLKQIETLSQIRDSLLPRLMSGKLRVK